ncbi:hypothetical protein [Nostoc sp.]
MQESMIYQDIRILQKGEERAKKQEALLNSNSQSDLVTLLRKYLFTST